MKKSDSVEIDQAIATFDSIITRCQKAQLKFTVGTSQHSLLVNRIKSMQLCQCLLKQQDVFSLYSNLEIESALAPLVSSLHKCQKAQEKHDVNSPTYRRLQPLIHALLLAQPYLIDKIKSITKEDF